MILAQLRIHTLFSTIMRELAPHWCHFTYSILSRYTFWQLWYTFQTQKWYIARLKIQCFLCLFILSIHRIHSRLLFMQLLLSSQRPFSPRLIELHSPPSFDQAALHSRQLQHSIFLLLRIPSEANILKISFCCFPWTLIMSADGSAFWRALKIFRPTFKAKYTMQIFRVSNYHYMSNKITEQFGCSTMRLIWVMMVLDFGFIGGAQRLSCIGFQESWAQWASRLSAMQSTESVGPRRTYIVARKRP